MQLKVKESGNGRGVFVDKSFKSGEVIVVIDGNYLNHSCESNTGIVKRRRSLALKAIRPIKKGVGRFGSLPPPLQDKYNNLGGAPYYIQKSLT